MGHKTQKRSFRKHLSFNIFHFDTCFPRSLFTTITGLWKAKVARLQRWSRIDSCLARIDSYLTRIDSCLARIGSCLARTDSCLASAAPSCRRGCLFAPNCPVACGARLPSWSGCRPVAFHYPTGISTDPWLDSFLAARRPSRH